jgi:hypothetical protein
LPAVTPTPLTSRPTDLLAIIQRPRARPKVIAEGKLAGACHDQASIVAASGYLQAADIADR